MDFSLRQGAFQNYFDRFFAADVSVLMLPAGDIAATARPNILRSRVGSALRRRHAGRFAMPAVTEMERAG